MPRSSFSGRSASLSSRARNTALFSYFVLGGAGFGVWVARLPSIRDDLGVSIAELGILSFALPAGSLVGIAVASPLLLRLGSRSSLVIGMIGLAAALSIVGLGSSVLHSYAVVFTALLFTGVTLGFSDVVMNVEGAAAERALGRALLPRLHAGPTLGVVLAALGGAASAQAGWPVAAYFLPASALILAVALTSMRWIPRRNEFADAEAAPERAPLHERLRSSLHVWRDPRLVLIGLSLFAFAFTEGTANDWLTVASVDGLQLDNAGGAVTLGLFVTVLTITRFFGGPALDRFGRVLTLRVGAVLAVAGVILFVFGDHLAWAATGVILWAVGVTFGFPVLITAAAEGPNAAQRVSAASMIGYTALLAGPPVLGLLAEHTGILRALLLGIGLLAIAFFTVPAAREGSSAAPAVGPRELAPETEA